MRSSTCIIWSIYVDALNCRHSRRVNLWRHSQILEIRIAIIVADGGCTDWDSILFILEMFNRAQGFSHFRFLITTCHCLLEESSPWRHSWRRNPSALKTHMRLGEHVFSPWNSTTMVFKHFMALTTASISVFRIAMIALFFNLFWYCWIPAEVFWTGLLYLLCLIPNVTSRMTDSSSDHHPTFGSSCRFLWDGLTVCTCSASNTAAMMRPYSQMGPTSIFPGLPTWKESEPPQITWLTAVLRCGCIWVVMLHALLGFV